MHFANMYYDLDDDALYNLPQDTTSMNSNLPPPASLSDSIASDCEYLSSFFVVVNILLYMHSNFEYEILFLRRGGCNDPKEI